MKSIIYSKTIMFIILTTSLFVLVFFVRSTFSLGNSGLILLYSIFIIYEIIAKIDAPNNYLHVLILLLLLPHLFFNIPFKLKNIRIVLKIATVLMASICLIQMLQNYLENQNRLICATLDNPSGISVFLSLCFPLITNSNNRRFTFEDYFWMSLVFLVILLIESRSGILSLIIILFLRLIKGNMREQGPFPMALIILFVTFLFSMFCTKNNSTLGRFFIYMASLSLVFDNLWFGHGYYGFTSEYMQSQASYFKCHPNSIFSDLADETMHPLNEFISLFISSGIVGVLLITSIVWKVYSMRNEQYEAYYYCLVAFFVQSLCTYTLRYPFVWFFVILCISQIAQNSTITTKVMNYKRIFVFLACIFSYFIVFHDMFYEYNWHKTFTQRPSTLSNYERLSNHWNGNPFFWYNYAAISYYENRYEQSCQLLKRYIMYVDDYSARLMLANNYYERGMYDSASINYSNAFYMCPNRFVPLQGLLRSYKKMNYKNEADSIACQIINKRPKIDSYMVSVIKAEAHKYLNYGK